MMDKSNVLKRLNGAACAALCLCLASPVAAQQPDAPPVAADMGQDLGAATSDAPSAATSPEDHPVAKTLNSAFAQVEALSRVSASFKDGVLTLRGAALSPAMRDQANALAQRQPGVLLVNDLIKIDAPAEQTTRAAAPRPETRSSQDEQLQRNLEAIFAQVPELSQVRVLVSAGVVQLRGQVSDLETAQRVEQLAQKLDGVVFVSNRLEVSTEIKTRISPAWQKAQSLYNGLISRLPLLLIGLVVLALAWFSARVITQSDRLFRYFNDRPLLGELVRQIVRTVIVLGGVLFVLELFGITSLVGALLGTAGVAGVALGFAFRDIVENYLASILLSIRHPFRKGDFVQIGDYQGKVSRMTTRDTVLLTLDGNHLRIPNAYVFKSTICNYTLNPKRRFDFIVGVGVNESLVDAKQLGLDAIRSVEGVLDDPAAFMLIDDLGDFSVLCHFYAWVDQERCDLFTVRSEAIRQVKLAFDKAQIDMPEPSARRYVYARDEVAKAASPSKADDGRSALQDAGANATDQLDALASEDLSAQEEGPDLLKDKTL